MQPGTKVQARRDHSVNPWIRGMAGVVVGPGDHPGTVAVRFDHATANVDPAVLDIAADGPEESPCQN